MERSVETRLGAEKLLDSALKLVLSVCIKAGALVPARKLTNFEGLNCYKLLSVDGDLRGIHHRRGTLLGKQICIIAPFPTEQAGPRVRIHSAPPANQLVRAFSGVQREKETSIFESLRSQLFMSGADLGGA